MVNFRGLRWWLLSPSLPDTGEAGPSLCRIPLSTHPPPPTLILGFFSLTFLKRRGRQIWRPRMSIGSPFNCLPPNCSPIQLVPVFKKHTHTHKYTKLIKKDPTCAVPLKAGGLRISNMTFLCVKWIKLPRTHTFQDNLTKLTGVLWRTFLASSESPAKRTCVLFLHTFLN